MTHYFKIILTISLGLSLSACMVDEGALNSPEINPPKAVAKQANKAQPQVAEHNISGKISHGVYVASVGKTAEKFSVMVPQTKDVVDYQYTRIADQIGQNYTQATFGPGFHNKNIYRVMVSTLPPNTQTIPTVRATFKLLVASVQKKYKVQPIKLMQQHTTINHHSAYFAVYQQNLKSGEVLTQLLYIMRRGHYLVRFGITASNQSDVDTVNGKNRFDVVKSNWQPANNFIESFKLGVKTKPSFKAHSPT